MSLSTEEQEKLASLVLAAWNRACQHYALQCSPPQVDLSLKGRAAGQAVWTEKRRRFFHKPLQMRLRINSDAYRLAPQYVAETVIPHEVAHLFVQLLHPKKRLKPHGEEWKSVMRECFGLTNPSRTHRLPLPQKRHVARPYLYHCSCGRAHHLTQIRHNRAERGVAYSCAACNDRLRFIGRVSDS